MDSLLGWLGDADSDMEAHPTLEPDDSLSRPA